MTTETESFESLKDTLKELTFSAPEITSLLKTTNSNKILLADSNTKFIQIDKRERNFSTDTPFFLRRLSFTGENIKNIEVTVSNADGSTKVFKVSQNPPSNTCMINLFCSAFQVKSKTKENRPNITGIKAYGISSSRLLTNASQVSNFFNAYNLLDKKLAETEQKLGEQQVVLDTQKEEIQNQKTEIDELRKQSKELTNNLNNKHTSLSNFNKNINKAEQRISALNQEEIAKKNSSQQLDEEIRIANTNIAKASEELSSLINDRSLISDEFRDFVAEGKSQAKIYLHLMILPCFIIGLSAVFLYNGASDILHGTYETKNDVAAALLLRIPFAAALAGAIYCSASIASTFLKRIFFIEDDRLTLAKLLVIAKDAVFSTAEQTGISSSEKFHLRTKLKIEMLKAHLSNNIGKNFQFPTYKKDSSTEEKIEEDFQQKKEQVE